MSTPLTRLFVRFAVWLVIGTRFTAALHAQPYQPLTPTPGYSAYPGYGYGIYPGYGYGIYPGYGYGIYPGYGYGIYPGHGYGIYPGYGNGGLGMNSLAACLPQGISLSAKTGTLQNGNSNSGTQPVFTSSQTTVGQKLAQLGARPSAGQLYDSSGTPIKFYPVAEVTPGAYMIGMTYQGGQVAASPQQLSDLVSLSQSYRVIIVYQVIPGA